MNFKSFYFSFFSIFALLFVVSCDKDFNEIGSSIVGGDNDHYLFDKYEDATIKAYNQKIGPVAMTDLPVNPLGIYKNPVFGTTSANFVTQVEIASGSLSRTFNNTDPTAYELLPVVDSVILNVPYFNKLVSTDTDGKRTYTLDSIYGVPETKMKLSVYESGYFLRTLDPAEQFTEQQVYFNDIQDVENLKIPSKLNNAAVNVEDNNADGHQNEQFYFDKREHKTTIKNSSNEDIDARTPPSMRLHLDKNTFLTKILNAPSTKLVDNVTFKNYFRGLYFKIEDLGSTNTMAMINFANAKLTVYYREDKKVTNATTSVVTFERVSKTFEMNLTGKSVSLQNNSNENANYIAATNSTSEASKLYLKGGQGSIAIIDLFGTIDTYRYSIAVDGSGNQLKDSKGNLLYIKTNSPNAVADELDDLKFANIEKDGSSIYYSKSKAWLINEASLTFYIDKVAMSPQLAVEPYRILLFDLNNNTVLVDYVTDVSQNTRYPKQNKFILGGILADEGNVFIKQTKNNDGMIENKGIQYKLRLTNHVKNLIKKDSTNVRLGLVVTELINNIGFAKLRTTVGGVKRVPAMSALSPVGTILYGTNIPFSSDPQSDYAKRLKLQIYYTKPD